MGFTDAFRQRLEAHAYTRWASDLSEDHLGALLWLIGELYVVLNWVQEAAAADPPSKRCPEALAELSHALMHAGRNKSTAMFQGDLRKTLALGKYSSWAAGVTEDELENVLRLLGELRPDFPEILGRVKTHRGTYGTYHRPLVASEGLFAFIALNKRCSREVAVHMRGRGVMQLMAEQTQQAFDEIPPSVLAAAERASSMKQWRTTGVEGDSYWVGGDGAGGVWTRVTVAPNGATTVLRAIPASDVPPQVMAALRVEIPEPASLVAVHAIGPRHDKVDRYKFLCRLPSDAPGEMRECVVGADCRVIRESP